ncbi:MAG: DCC1-like thiol-disulfide oxidoreductase family protein [Cyanobacteria bacterium P01_H01_bin.74]
MTESTAVSSLAISTLRIFYDGDCILCNHYAHHLQLKQITQYLELVDLRNEKSLILLQEALSKGIVTLNKGMIVQIDSAYYQGAQAITVLSHLTTSTRAINRIIAMIFKTPALGNSVYPLMLVVRKLTFWVQGKSAEIKTSIS